MPPRKSQATISSVVRIPAASATALDPEAEGEEQCGQQDEAFATARDPATAGSGAIEDASWSRPRTSRTRDARERRAGIALVQVTVLVANAQ